MCPVIGLGKGRRSLKPIEQDFLPAALSLQSTPPSPVGRLLAVELSALLLIVIVWMLVSEVDIHAVAPGELVPVGQSKLIGAPRLSVVRQILVAEGDVVDQGDSLLALDASAELTRRSQVKQEMVALEQEQQRLLALISALGEWVDDGVLPSTPKTLDHHERRRFRQTFTGIRSQVEKLKTGLQRQRAALQLQRVELTGLESRRPLVERISRDLEHLQTQNMVSEHQYLQAKLDVIESAAGIASSNERIKLHQLEIKGSRHAIDNLIATTYNDWLSQLSQTQLKLSQLTTEAEQLEVRIADLTLRAPVAGRVEELQVHAEGAVVDTAQTLLKLVPLPYTLSVKAHLPNRDRGQVTLGQPVKIKVDSFPYTKFGILEGVVAGIATDSSKSANRDNSYRIEIALPQENIQRWGESRMLRPGMRVSVEIRTGQRRLIEFFLAPLLRYRSESLHER